MGKRKERRIVRRWAAGFAMVYGSGVAVGLLSSQVGHWWLAIPCDLVAWAVGVAGYPGDDECQPYQVRQPERWQS